MWTTDALTRLSDVGKEKKKHLRTSVIKSLPCSLVTRKKNGPSASELSGRVCALRAELRNEGGQAQGVTRGTVAKTRGNSNTISNDSTLAAVLAHVVTRAPTCVSSPHRDRHTRKNVVRAQVNVANKTAMHRRREQDL